MEPPLYTKGVCSVPINVGERETNPTQETMETAVSLVSNPQSMIILPSDPRVVFSPVLPGDIEQQPPTDTMDPAIQHTIGDNYNTMSQPQITSMMMQYNTGESMQDSQKSIQVEETVQTRYNNTLVGRISKIIREEKRPMKIEEIVDKIAPIFSTLRKMDGTLYKGKTKKAVNGALSSTGVFKRLSDSRWDTRDEELDIYAKRAQEKIKSKRKDKRMTPTGEEEKKPDKRKYTKRRDRKQTLIETLDDISKEQRALNNERTNAYTICPFGNATGNENAEELKNIMGENRFIFCMQLYAYFEDIFKRASGYIPFDAQHMAYGGSDMIDPRLLQMEKELNDIDKRISCLEKMINGQPTMTM